MTVRERRSGSRLRRSSKTGRNGRIGIELSHYVAQAFDGLWLNVARRSYWRLLKTISERSQASTRAGRAGPWSPSTGSGGNRYECIGQGDVLATVREAGDAPERADALHARLRFRFCLVYITLIVRTSSKLETRLCTAGERICTERRFGCAGGIWGPFVRLHGHLPACELAADCRRLFSAARDDPCAPVQQELHVLLP